MAVARRPCSGTERLGKAGSVSASEGGMGKLGHSVGGVGVRGGAWHKGGTRVSYGGGALLAWWPRGHSAEYVASANEPDLDLDFGIFHLDSDLGACTKVVSL